MQSFSRKINQQFGVSIIRFFSTTGIKKNHQKGDYRTEIFYHHDLITILATELRAKPKSTDPLKFGHHYTDHMFEVNWQSGKGWDAPTISPLHNLSLHPGSKVFHYAIELFEGLKAYKGIDGKIRLFRPDMNMQRMRRTAERASLPDFSGDELLKIINDLVQIEREWIPNSPMTSLYIRPAFIGTDPTLGVGKSSSAKLFVLTSPIGQYWDESVEGEKAVSLLADPAYVRSFYGGVGAYKMGCNYAPTIFVAQIAHQKQCQQVLWLHGPNENIAEVGTMNIFVFWKNEQGEEELITPTLSGEIILPGITRDSIITLAQEWNEFKVIERNISMAEIRKATKEKRILQIFGSGTACVVTPVGRILYKNNSTDTYEELLIPTLQCKANVMQRCRDAISDIQYGKRIRSKWVMEVKGTS